jgi:hypothetical protein
MDPRYRYFLSLTQPRRRNRTTFHTSFRDVIVHGYINKLLALAAGLMPVKDITVNRSWS